MVTNTLHPVCENPTLHEIHRGTISAHHAKAGYDYPTPPLHVLRAYRAADAHLSDGARWGAGIPCRCF